MRGFLLLVIGAGLIWLGVKTSGGRTEPETVQASTGSLALGGEGPVAPGSAPADALREADIDGPGQGDRAETVPPEGDPIAAPAVNRGPSNRGAPARPARAGTPPPKEDQASRLEPSSFELGPPGGPAGGLGELLLECWIHQDPRALETWLNDASDGIPMARRRLVAAFWQAVAGDAERARGELEALAGAEGVTGSQLELLRTAGLPRRDRPIPASIGRRDPLSRAMRMVLLDDLAADAAESGEPAVAARGLSDLIQLELGAPWAPHRPALLEWAQALNRSQAFHRLSPKGEWPSKEYLVRPGDSLERIRSRLVREDPGLSLCTGLIERVNGIERFIHPGDLLRIPTDRPNVLVDLDARLAVYRHGSEVVHAWEVGIGKDGHETPAGTFQVGIKQPNPSWMPLGREGVPFGHPENPLGTRWIGWHVDGDKTGFGFHGTSDPGGVGGQVSLGCVRMRNEDVEMLYDLLPIGSTVIVQP